jgi:hypothetical protein
MFLSAAIVEDEFVVPGILNRFAGNGKAHMANLNGVWHVVEVVAGRMASLHAYGQDGRVAS